MTIASLDPMVYAAMNSEFSKSFDGNPTISLSNDFGAKVGNVSGNFDQALGVIAPDVNAMALG